MSLGKSILWVFCLGSGPFFCLCLVCCCLFCCFLWRNASLAGGFAGRRGLVVLCGFWFLDFDLPAHMDQLCPCTNVFSTAYAHVYKDRALARHRPNSRKKKDLQVLRLNFRSDASHLTIDDSRVRFGSVKRCCDF